MIRRLITRLRLWRWDQENGAVLSLAERRQTERIGATGERSAILSRVIDKLRRERASIAGERHDE